jgi:hypothetical protein
MHNSGALRCEDAKPYLMNTNAPHSQPSSPAKAGDPVFRGAGDRTQELRRAEYSAEYDGLCKERCDAQFGRRHSGAMRSIEPGISRFPDVQLHI